MTNPATAPTSASTVPPPPPPTPIKLDLMGALLSYLVPGLGQITQGRTSKGLLFFFAIYSLFLYGFVLGQKKNVYLPHYSKSDDTINRFIGNVTYRFQIVGQAPMGIVVWPAFYQYFVHDEAKPAPLNGFMKSPSVEEINDMQRQGDKTWDLGWVYTVIAGVLNILVIYDALAGPAFRKVVAPSATTDSEGVAKAGAPPL
jgi:hypothetical protein